MGDKYSCDVCSDTGWVYCDEVRAVKRCECFLRKRQDLFLKNSGIPERYKNCRLDNFKIYAEENNKRIFNRELSIPYEFSRKFVLQYPDVDKGILFTGKCGLGKTHIAAAILMEILLKKGASVRFYDWRDLMKAIQACYAEDGKSEKEIMRPIIGCDLLCIDELGAKRVSDFFLDTLTVIINNRYNQNKLTIITSNWVDKPTTPMEESLTDRIGYSLRSRLYEMCCAFELKGKDYRAKQKDTFTM